jgi:transglutaminase-like putative cysteine protease
LKGSEFELLVKRDLGTPSPAAGPAALTPNFFLDSTDKVVVAMAATSSGKTPWEIARALERMVHEKMSTTSGIGFATAGQVARELRGDCRQHAMLLATLCRARGIPSRTALGLVYIVDRPTGRPALGFHMWTEVYCDGAWRGLDATLGEGRIGPGHVKVTDTTWADAPSLAPLLPVLRVMGRLKATVVSFR